MTRPLSRFSIRHTTSRPSAFQSSADNQLKYRQPSVVFAHAAASFHWLTGRATVTVGPSMTGSTPNFSRIRDTASVGFTRRSPLLRGGGPAAQLLELGDLLLELEQAVHERIRRRRTADRKSTRLNSSHSQISYAVFCLKKKK